MPREPLFHEISCSLISFLLFRFSLESQQYRRRKLKGRGYSGFLKCLSDLVYYPAFDRRASKSEVILFSAVFAFTVYTTMVGHLFFLTDLSFNEEK